MPRVKAHHNTLTLPDDLRDALHIVGDDELDAEVIEEGVLIRPSREARRGAGFDRIRRAQASVRASPELAAMTPEEQEHWIADALAADSAEA